MWTPRRVLLLLAGLLGFGAAYLGYAQFLGSIDGLPQLPAKYLEPADIDGPAVFPERESPTVTRLKEAFGDNCPELSRLLYPFQVEELGSGADSVVLASGSPAFGKEPSRFVKVAPFSLAVFGKPRPPHERTPGEVAEISTLHSDEAIVELDKPVGSEQELLRGKPKIVGLELRAAADNRFNKDPRAGRVVIKNNQRSADPNRWLEFKTQGPVFYRDPGHPDLAATPGAPHVWTAAAVEIVNRDNLPRPVRKASLPAVPGRVDDGLTRAADVVADMALGLRSPPPTVTADGMKIYLKPTPPAPPTAKAKRGPAFGGVRELVLNENVVFNLWTDGKAGFPGSGPQPTDKPAPADPPTSLTAVAGGLVDGRAAESRLRDKALVTIRTLGPFRYDWEKNAARFDVAPQANPLLPNNVELTRFMAAGGRDLLICQQLDIEFNGPIAQGAGAPPPPGKAAGPGFKAVRATGSHVFLAAEADQLQAQGTFLEYTTDPARSATRTVLRGSPLLVLRQLNKLEAGMPTAQGRPAVPGQLVLESVEPPPAPSKPAEKRTKIDVYGPGRVELYDEATKAATLFAGWRESLSQTKDRIGDKDVDLLVFAGGGAFADPKGAFHLSADTLKLWLEAAAPAKQPRPGEKEKAGQPLPARLQGIGHVNGRSQDAVIKDTDQLNVWFKDTAKSIRQPVAQAPPAAAPPPAAAKPDGLPPPPPYLEPVATIPPKDNPLHLSARAIEVTLCRFPTAKPAAPPQEPPPPGGTGLQYELEKAECQDRVVVHQDPADPLKSPRGLDITAAKLNMENRPAGYDLRVTGTPKRLAEVQFESVFIAGPVVAIDQPNNRVKVDGQGRLKMPSSSGLGGTATGEPADLTIDWLEEMDFRGERRSARFVGQVQAVQEAKERKPDPAAEPTRGRSWVLCHLLDVTFDRPIYFNQLKDRGRDGNRSRTVTAARIDAGGKAPNPDDPRIERVRCSHRPEDAELLPGKARVAADDWVAFGEDVLSRRTGKHVKAQRITARFIDVQAEPDRTLISASGPGETRTLQPGAKDYQPTPADPPTAKPKGEEMKLTLVKFRDQLTIQDRKGGVFQEAKFRGQVASFHVPTEDAGLTFEEYNPPPRSVVLRCADELTVSSYRETDAGEPDRRMVADGEASVRTDDYDGRGQKITYDGTLVVLHGDDYRQATLYRRHQTVDGRNFQSGNPLTYDTKTGKVSGAQTSGGSFSTPAK